MRSFASLRTQLYLWHDLSFEPPLKGVRVVELTHTILGPSCGMILADLGAEVIKVEPVDGDRTRRLRGFGGGFFGYFNRNKKSLALDADSPEGREVLVKLLQSADVMIENFAPGSMAKRGLGPEHLEKINPRLVYCALKGFLPGPYEKRPALDEVVQMMGGLAYMTGPSGPAAARRHLGGRHHGRHVRRLRHGAGAEAARAHGQGRAGRKRAVRIGGVPDGPASGHHRDERRAAAADARAGELVGDLRDLHDRRRPADLHRHHLGRPVEALLRVLQAGQALAADPKLATNNQRIEARPWLVPKVAEVFKRYTKDELEQMCLDADISFAPVARPQDLFDHPHLLANGSLAATTLPGGVKTRLPLLPFQMMGWRPPLVSDPPRDRPAQRRGAGGDRLRRGRHRAAEVGGHARAPIGPRHRRHKSRVLQYGEDTGSR